MANINDGGPAFPFSQLPNTAILEGMTLRDYFAAKALAAIIEKLPLNTPLNAPETSSNPLVGLCVRDIFDGGRGGKWEAEAAYVYADAMISARTR